MYLLCRAGCFILVDIFRQPNESLPQYHERQQEEVTNVWTALSTEERSRMTDHMLKVCPPSYPFLPLFTFQSRCMEPSACCARMQKLRACWQSPLLLSEVHALRMLEVLARLQVPSLVAQYHPSSRLGMSKKPHADVSYTLHSRGLTAGWQMLPGSFLSYCTAEVQL